MEGTTKVQVVQVGSSELVFSLGEISCRAGKGWECSSMYVCVHMNVHAWVCACVPCGCFWNQSGKCMVGLRKDLSSRLPEYWEI